MNYPLISEYVDAIRSAEDNFDKLCDLRPVLDGNGNPLMSSGNFAVVFKMEDVNTGKLYAVKCFTKEQGGREEAYRQIADELEFVQSTYLAKIKYYDHELFVDVNGSDDSEFPVLLMDWVEGETLDKYIRQNIDDTYALAMLAYNFSRLAMWLLPQPFAHGDLKPDNILVHDDVSLTLVDYDGMYVPAMQGQKSRELGSPDFRHPLRTEDDFNEHIDDFPAISILLSLRLIAYNPSLLDEYGASDRLLFSESYYRDLSSCKLIKSVFPSQDAEINTLVSLFTITDIYKTLSYVSSRLLAVKKPKKLEVIKILSTEVTEEDLANAVEDEFGAKYSPDWIRLLKVPHGIKKYKIKDRTEIICNNAFSECFFLSRIILPPSITSIGDSTFSSCSSLQHLTIPVGITSIGNYTFYSCGLLQQIILPPSVITIGENAFSYCENLQKVTLPTSITSIGESAFFSCESLQEIIVPPNVTSIGPSAFSNCLSLHKVVLPSSVININDGAFFYCTSLHEITLPSNIISIGDESFSHCSALQKIVIPSGVITIGENAFSWCENLQQILIPASVKSIGYDAFCCCSSLKKIIIPQGCKARFTKMLPELKDKLVEEDQIDDFDDLPF